jgi:hypothetical protein
MKHILIVITALTLMQCSEKKKSNSGKQPATSDVISMTIEALDKSGMPAQSLSFTFPERVESKIRVSGSSQYVVALSDGPVNASIIEDGAGGGSFYWGTPQVGTHSFTIIARDVNACKATSTACTQQDLKATPKSAQTYDRLQTFALNVVAATTTNGSLDNTALITSILGILMAQNGSQPLSEDVLKQIQTMITSAAAGSSNPIVQQLATLFTNPVNGTINLQNVITQLQTMLGGLATPTATPTASVSPSPSPSGTP